MKNELSVKTTKMLSGFAAGVMIAASVWSLLIPALEIQLYAVQTAVLHGVRQHTEEVAHAHTRFQNVVSLLQ